MLIRTFPLIAFVKYLFFSNDNVTKRSFLRSLDVGWSLIRLGKNFLKGVTIGPYERIFSRKATLGSALSVCLSVCLSYEFKRQNQVSKSRAKFKHQNQVSKYCFVAILNEAF